MSTSTIFNTSYIECNNCKLLKRSPHECEINEFIYPICGEYLICPVFHRAYKNITSYLLFNYINKNGNHLVHKRDIRYLCII